MLLIVKAKLCTWLLLLTAVAFSLAQEPIAYHSSSVKAKYQDTDNNSKTLGALITEIEKKHPVSFICRSELLDIRINSGNVNFKEKTFADKLQKLLKPYRLLVKQITKEQYAITYVDALNETSPVNDPKKERSAGNAFSGSQDVYYPQPSVISNRKINMPVAQINITGIVTAGSTNSPLEGVTVAVKGTEIATATNKAGKFEINVPSEQSVLAFSFVGYITREIPVNNQTTINVALDENEKSMDQVVVVGYGTQKKVNLSGAVDAIKGKEIESRPVTSVSSALQGMVAGLTIRATNPRPGLTGGTIRIRGVGTLGAGADPLLVIDGILQLSPGSMDHLNPDDIENISVLKDAAASAIYGARGANGVILITTKKGKSGNNPNIGYSYYYGIQIPTAQAEFLGSPHYMELLNEAQQNVDRTPTYTAAQIQTAKDGTDPNYFANTNWVKEIFKSAAPQQNHNLSVNGGNSKSGYYLSYGYLNQDGLVTGDAYQARRHNVRLRLNTEVMDRLQLDGNIGYMERNYSEPTSGTDQNTGVIYSAHQISPLVPVRFTTGNWGYGGGSQNPIATASEAGLDKFASQQFSGNISATLRIIDKLTLKGQYGLIQENSLRNEQVNTLRYFYPETGNLWYTSNPVNSIQSSDSVIRNQNLSVQLDYGLQYKKHDVKVLIGYSQEWLRADVFSARRQNLVSPSLPILNIGTENPTNGSRAYHRAIQSVFGRINYSFREKYLLEINHRLDATSRFAEHLRWDGFPSFSAGWRISEESFMDIVKPTLSSAKLRGSWGRLGNENTFSRTGTTSSNYYPYLSVLNTVTTMPIGGVLTSAFAQTTAENPDLFWEYIEMWNIGMDLGFLEDRLSISGDYFVKKTNDILAVIPLPDVLGVSEPHQNLISVENKGWELTVGWNDNIGKAKYGFRFNLSDVQNKVTNLAGVNPVIDDQVRIVGYPIDAFYGLVVERISQTEDFDYDATTNKYTPKFPVLAADLNNTKPGDLIYQDLNDDKNITLDKDRKVIGDPFPRYLYALRGNLELKGLDFSFFLQGVGKGNGYILGPARHALVTEATNPQKVHLDRWTPDNTDASYPRLTYQQTHNQRLSTFWLENAAYLRLKNIQLGYTLPASLTSKVRAQRLRVYVSADNLFTKTNFFYAYDPETPLSSGGLYPQIKTVIFGLNINFK